MVKGDAKKVGLGKVKSGTKDGVAQEAGNKVPRGAENIEHVLRRLTIEKSRKRDKDWGLYF